MPIVGACDDMGTWVWDGVEKQYKHTARWNARAGITVSVTSDRVIVDVGKRRIYMPAMIA